MKHNGEGYQPSLFGFPMALYKLSLRHLSTTMKLIISKGDVKAIQGDTGHAQAKMVTDTYAHILDKNRKKTAMKFEKAFYNDEDESDVSPDALLEKLADYCANNPNAMDKLKNILSFNNDDGSNI